MTGVLTKLRLTGYTHIGSAIVNRRCGSTHGCIIVSAIIQLNPAQGIPVKFSIITYGNAIEISPFGCEIIISGCIVSHRIIASQIAGMRQSQIIQYFSGFRIHRQYMRIAGAIACLTIIGSFQHKRSTFIDICTCPVITAFLSMCPGCHFCFCLGRWIFIGC